MKTKHPQKGVEPTLETTSTSNIPQRMANGQHNNHKKYKGSIPNAKTRHSYI
jgi:hypothetical protein